MTDQIKMRTAADLWSDDSGDDYDTDEELAKVKTTTTRLKKKGAKEPEKPLDPEEEKLKMKKKMERAAEKKKRKEEKAARKAQKKEEKRRRRAERAAAKEKGGNKGEKGKKEGYESGDSYDSGDALQRTAEDDDFLDLDDDDEDIVREYNEQEQNFGDERGERGPKKKKGTKRGASGEKMSGTRAADMDNPVMQAMARMKRQRIVPKKVEELEAEAQKFITEMDQAAEADEESNRAKKPGLEKLKLMRKVTDTLANTQLMRPLLEFDVLKSVYRWIMPIKGKLGNVTIRRDLLVAVGKMDGESGVQGIDLKRSNLGKLVMALYNHPNETKEMKQIEKKLIDQWSRPIFRKSGNYRDLQDAEQERRIAGFKPKAMAMPSGMAATSDNKKSPAGARGSVGDVLAKGIRSPTVQTAAAKSNRVSIPYSKGFSYTVRPNDKIDSKTEDYMAGTRVKQGGTAEKLSKIMLEKSRPTIKNQRSQNISIEGRAVKN
mmetsp:Transcript_19060/g.39688  ORF Transcript_19060/g.39688 Transcript_19060/m.39688 type:complete len:489 (-) Transcript_19060:96-1562(-)|eukprot:CAMPEP_0118650540 /NCGR_PEP_ID=MMETSP0785-20121206/10301_1 /TAXON_ID=91992 /ORGANISM="Bolidomonas pacifica, Strain CCMP 1866" /LENGTH=488 /DNA_ID=CAMNT_0006542921 /DNA_START=39 /DNA_END=1505 /DNA_ORIENTATION=+